jgi:acetate kinase
MSKILTLNAGSSSLKFRLYGDKNIKEGEIDRIGLDHSFAEVNGARVYVKLRNMKEALKLLFKIIGEFDIIAHRVVHGGGLEETCLITKDVIKKIKENIELAPLHNAPELEAINHCMKHKQYAVFDTLTFEDNYPLPGSILNKYKIKRYGFHGLAHKYVMGKLKEKRIINCHLGQGGSVAAIENGKIIKNSFGFTPLDGVIMGTRSGNIDPGLVLYLCGKLGYRKVEEILNKYSGLKALSGKESFKDVIKRNNKKVLEKFADSVVKYISYYFTVLGNVDGICFTGGVGYNEGLVREMIVNKLKVFNVKLDGRKNKANKENLISSKSSKVKIYRIKVDEQEVIYNEVMKKI